MLISDMMQPSGRVFLKSEWGPISDYWPCVSFTKPSVGTWLRKEFVPGRDVLVYVGTTNPAFTEDPDHQSRLISAVVMEPNQVLETKKIVPVESWNHAVERHGDRWPHALAAIRAADIVGPPYPHARQVMPRSYRSFADFANRGKVIEAHPDERDAIMTLEVRPLTLRLREGVAAYIGLRESTNPAIEKTIREEASRMTQLICDRVSKGGEQHLRVNPQRFAPPFAVLNALLLRKWLDEQRGKCALCGGPLDAATRNPMLKASADRIDSANGAYDDGNVQITHLACNLAKNQYGQEQFDDWVLAVRGVQPALEKIPAEVPS